MATLILLFASGAYPAQATDLSGRAVDPQNLRLVNAQIRISPAIDSGRSPLLRETVTDSQGEFQFLELAPGSYTLQACAAGFDCRDLWLQIDGDSMDTEVQLAVAGLHEGIVVTATREQTATSKAPLAVSLLPGQNLAQQIPVNLAQGLQDIPGVAWVNAGAFRGRPVIRGLDSNRILVLVDGERLNNGRTSTNNAGIETSLVDISQVEQVEVVRGPGSVLYGSDAFGGVLNIRTRTSHSSDELRVGARLRGEFLPNSDGRRAHAEVSASNRWLSLRAGGSVGAFQDYDSPRGTVFGSGVDENSAMGEVRLYPAANQSFFLKFLQRGAYNFGLPSLDPRPTFFATFPFSKLQKFSTGYRGNFDSLLVSTLELRLYRQDQTRDFFNDLTLPFGHILSDTVTDLQTYGMDLQLTSIAASRHILTYGISSYRDRNRDRRIQLMQARGTTQILDQAPSVPLSTFFNAGMFLQDQYSIAPALRLISGLRVDRFRLEARPTANFNPNVLEGIAETRTDTAWSGNLGVSWEAASGWVMTGNVARAFREPNLFERYFLGRGSVGGFVVPNPDLDPETSVQFDVGTRWQGGPLRASVNYFVNALRNLITSGPGVFMGQSTIGGEPVRQNLNVDRARIQGIESTAEMSIDALGSRWTPLLTAAWQRGSNQTTEDHLPLISPFVGQLGLHWSPRGSRVWTEWRTQVAKGSERVPMGSAPLSGYTVHSIRWGYELTRGERIPGAFLPRGFASANFNFSVQNLANRLYRGLFENVPQPGREIRFGIDLNLDSSAR